MKIVFDSSNIEELGKELTQGIADFEKDAKPVLMKLGERAADEVVRAILAGKDLGGGALKPNEPSTAHRKDDKYGHHKPLIATGQLSDRREWKVAVRRSKKGTLIVSINPKGDRKKIFYGYLPAKGYNRSQGLSQKMGKEASAVTSELIKTLFTRWLKDIE